MYVIKTNETRPHPCYYEKKCGKTSALWAGDPKKARAFQTEEKAKAYYEQHLKKFHFYREDSISFPKLEDLPPYVNPFANMF